MKPLGPLRPEPGPSARESWSLALSLAMVAIGCALRLNVFHERGAIGDELHLAALIFVIAVPLGPIIAVVQERRTYIQVHKSIGQTAYKYRVYKEWPHDPRLGKEAKRVSRKPAQRLRRRK